MQLCPCRWWGGETSWSWTSIAAMSDLPYELKTIPGYRARAGGPQIGQYIGALGGFRPPH